MELKLKIYLVNGQGEKFMGIGVLWLLEEIAREGSIRKAAANLGLSYSKAHSMLKTLEDEIGHCVLERRKGGDSRDGAVITPFGKQLTKLYSEFQREVKEQADTSFEAFLAAIEKEKPDEG
ncbi:MAG: winged helix-turn-helix domain-containing protein [Spirochaetota bacterium]